MRLHAALVVTLVLAATGCASSSGDNPGPASPSPQDSPEPTGDEPAPEAAETAALRAYDSMWEVVVEASHEGEPDPPELGDYASGDALALMRHMLEGAAEDEAAVEGEPVLDPEVVDVSPEDDPDTAVLLDCADGSEWIEHVEGASDENEDSSTGHREIDATVSSDGLSWRVSELRIWEPGSC